MIDLNELRKRARGLSPLVQIGKRGMTDSMAKEIRRQLQSKKIIKVRILKSAVSEQPKSVLIQDIVVRCEAVLVDQIGLTLILLKNSKEVKPKSKDKQ
ncbi:MAG: YhbY family RNA-binding protein [archaeon]